MGHTKRISHSLFELRWRRSATITINLISQEKAADATLGKKNADGLYYGVLPIRIYFF